jgi:flagellar FliL protein
MAKAEENKEGGGEAPKKKSKKMLIIVAAAVLVLLLGGGGIAFALMGSKEKRPEEPKPPLLKVAKLESFMVNLGEPSAFIKAVILLEYDQNALDRVIAGKGSGGGHGYGGGAAGGGAPDPTALPMHMKDREPMIRDAIIRVFASKKALEVLSPDGKDQLKEEIVESVNEALGYHEPVVTGVYFTEFIVQQG